MTPEAPPPNRDPGPSRLRQIEPLFPILLLTWRALAVKPSLVWCDWGIYVGLYWVFLLFARDPKKLERGSALLVLVLVGVYLARQLPFSIQTLRYAW